jgi:hypothetical protein
MFINKKDNKGTAIKYQTKELCGIVISFLKSFNPSKKACRIPKKPTLFGPIRVCLILKTCRSQSVEKAIANKINNKKKSIKKT